MMSKIHVMKTLFQAITGINFRAVPVIFFKKVAFMNRL
jgi:hypothetical protein